MLLSIIIPTYENLEIFSKCNFILDKNINEKNDFEIIISDDSETDIVEKFVSNYSHLKYYKHNRSQSPVDNWNFGLEKANGRYVWLLHHDEYINSLDPVIAELEQCESNKIDIFIFDVYNISNRSIKKFSSFFLKTVTIKFPYLFIAYNTIGSPSVLIHKNINLKYNRDLLYLTDVQYYYRLFSQGYKWRLSRQSIYSNIDVHKKNSITSSFTDLKKQHFFELSKLNLSFVKKKLLSMLIIIRYF